MKADSPARTEGAAKWRRRTRKNKFYFESPTARGARRDAQYTLETA